MVLYSKMISDKIFAITSIILFLALFLVSTLFSLFLEEFIIILYGFIFWVYLILLVFYGNLNPISSLYSIAVLLYFYQVPFIIQIADKSEGIYFMVLNNSALTEYLFLYSFIIFFNFCVIFFLRKRFVSWDSDFNSVQFKNSLKKIILPSFLISIFLLLVTIKKVGGFNSFLSLNKFESVQEAKFLFFTWKEFAVLAMASLVFSKIKNYFYYSLAIVFVFIEILTTKRLLMLCFVAFLYISFIRKLSFKSILAMVGLIFFSNLIKYTYYGLKGFFLGENDSAAIIWFTWGDFLKDSLLIGEFNGHLRLAYLSIYYSINHSYTVFFGMLGNMLPLSSNLNLEYMTAGEYLKTYLSESWSGLASSIYLTPYLSGSFIFVLLIYIIYISTIDIVYRFSRIFFIFKLVFICIIPFMFFYIQREEIMIITRNFYVYIPIGLLAYLIVILRKKFI